uniref:IBH1-like N-terminal domain-containing protein n=1 Tax=Zea mays TaxID=4577 RepID=A0A804NQC9_MAIZE
MHAPRRFRKAFTAQLLRSLRAAGQASKSLGLRERRDAVRLSSDVALALAASARAPRSPPAWARALVARHAAERRNEALLRRVLDGAGYELAAARARKDARSRRVVRRSRRVCSRGGGAGRKRRSLLLAAGGGGRCAAMAAARRMVRARLRVLRSLVPGAEAMRGLSLLSETLDYVASSSHLTSQGDGAASNWADCRCRAAREVHVSANMDLVLLYSPHSIG